MQEAEEAAEEIRRPRTPAEVMEMYDIELPNPFRVEEEHENEEQQNPPQVRYLGCLNIVSR